MIRLIWSYDLFSKVRMCLTVQIKQIMNYNLI